ncbi:MAG: head decoration protein [Proteobacteria bacterium]|nr:MAG: head decoration protein [Pseudomonadota bacterium]
MGYAPDFRKQAEYQPLDLIAGDFPLKTETVTIEAKQNLRRGAVLGKKAESGKYVLSAKLGGDDKPIADGSEKSRCILAFDIDATNGDTVTVAYKT